MIQELYISKITFSPLHMNSVIPHESEVSHDTCMGVVLFLSWFESNFSAAAVGVLTHTDTQKRSPNPLEISDIPTTYTAWISI